jgi:hypothetical protein
MQREVLAPIFYPVSPKVLAVFFRSMRAMLGAGLNIMGGASTLAPLTRN